MASEPTALTDEEFASLLTVGHTGVNSSAPLIPSVHSARLIALGHGGHRGQAADDDAGTNHAYVLGRSQPESNGSDNELEHEAQ